MRIAALVIVAATLGACSSPPPPPAAAPPPPPQKTVFDSQIQAIDKAKGVEQQVQDAKAAQDKKLEDAGG